MAVDSGDEDGNWSTMPGGAVTFRKKFLAPPNVTLTMKGGQHDFGYMGMVENVTRTGFTMYKKDVGPNFVGNAGEGFYWIAVGMI